MPRLTDTQRVELALPAAILFEIANPAAEPEDADILLALQGAARAPLDGLGLRDTRKVVERIRRASGAVQDGVGRGLVDTDVALAAALRWIDLVLEDGFLVLHSGSEADRAIARLRGIIGAGPFPEADERAASIMRALGARGYFLPLAGLHTAGAESTAA
ncbi:hypothetical protein [Azospirillum sp. TSH64]|uniref:hypothetical protein n=1 Tax=Azospirillum sp. TSH64 TaxID=652740 RepID=UPI000D60565C|nr:hypothetical protein [Azospirillum sp. TSH64]PWC81273.1 hypothetical protein TSH64_01120 [Azospirillum sp. TSH64]